MKKTLYKGIDPNDGKESYFIIQGSKVAPFHNPPPYFSRDIDYWSLYENWQACKVLESIPTFEIISEEDV